MLRKINLNYCDTGIKIFKVLRAFKQPVFIRCSKDLLSGSDMPKMCQEGGEKG